MAVPVDVTLTPVDIPRTELLEPLDRYTVLALRWWLTCRGVVVPSSARKAVLLER